VIKIRHKSLRVSLNMFQIKTFILARIYLINVILQNIFNNNN